MRNMLVYIAYTDFVMEVVQLL